MKYYFAGGLFDHKELIGNKLLADAIAEVSAGRWEALLPQDEENQLRNDPKSIRDNDFQMVLKSDAALFNFDGTELDSLGWFQAAALPEIPKKGSIARRIIDDFVNKNNMRNSH